MKNQTVPKLLFEKVLQKSFKNLPLKVRLCFDTREPIDEAKTVFFAFSQPELNGHGYIESALNKGAALVIADKKYQETLLSLPQEKLHFVDDPLEVYSQIAKTHLAALPTKKIAITGSNGKTTTKNFVYCVLAKVLGDEAVHKTFGNQNGFLGTPLTALATNENHQYTIFEVGMDAPGALSHHCSIINPDIVMVTNIECAHEGNFPDGIKGVQKEKGSIFSSLSKSGIAIINIDDPRITHEAAQRNLNHTVTVSADISKNTDITLVEAKNLLHSPYGQTAQVKYQDTYYTFSLKLLGWHNAWNATLALAVAHALGIDMKKATEAISLCSGEKSRMEIIENNCDILLIDDSYNADPVSFAQGLRVIRDLKNPRKIAVIGSMKERGLNSKEQNKELGKKLTCFFDRIYVCGEERKAIVEGILSAGFKADRVFEAKNYQELLEPLKATIRPKDLIYLKGSNSNKLWCVAHHLSS